MVGWYIWWTRSGNISLKMLRVQAKSWKNGNVQEMFIFA